MRTKEVAAIAIALFSITSMLSFRGLLTNDYTALTYVVNAQENNSLIIENDVVINGKKATGLVIIPDNVTEIGFQAFGGGWGGPAGYENPNSKLTSIYIPVSVKVIGMEAFFACPNFTDVYYQGTKEEWNKIEIANGNFDRVNIHFETKLPISENPITTVTAIATIPTVNSVTTSTSVEDNSEPLVIENNIVINGKKATGLVIIPDNVTEIGFQAFGGGWGGPAGYENPNSKLTSIYIPVSVKIIGMEAFFACPNLTDVYYQGTKEEWNKIEIANGNFDRVNIHFETKLPISENPITTVTAIATIPTVNSVTTSTSVEDNSEPLVIENNIVINGKKATGLVIIPDNVTEIGFQAFGGGWGGPAGYENPNSKLTSIYIPVSVKIIGMEAFFACPNLTDVYYQGTKEEWNKIEIANGNFDRVNIHFETDFPVSDNQITTTPVISTETGNEISTAIGDINSNGVINCMDLVRLIKAIIYNDIADTYFYDLNKDNTVDSRDLIYLKKILLNI